MHKNISTCKHLVPREFPLWAHIVICNKMDREKKKENKSLGLRPCVWMTGEAKLVEVSFWQKVKTTTTEEKGLPGKTKSWLVKAFRSARAFCPENDPLLLKDFLLEWWKRCSICFYVCAMLSKGNRIPQWQVAARANGRPRQIKSNGHLSCWQLKSHLSNYSWCLALRSNQSFQQRNKWCGARDHGLLWRSMKFIRKQVKLKNNKQLFRVQLYICCVWWIPTVASHLSLGYWRRAGIRVRDNRCTGEKTIPFYTVFYHWLGQPHIFHWNLIPHTTRVYSFFLALHLFCRRCH